jgi:hypothetical protein
LNHNFPKFSSAALSARFSSRCRSHFSGIFAQELPLKPAERLDNVLITDAIQPRECAQEQMSVGGRWRCSHAFGQMILRNQLKGFRGLHNVAVAFFIAKIDQAIASDR